ncbi:MAG TPA: nitroreductase family protein [Egibacteraceae bacterium]|nr:nitroreductase family protein [Actinomycetota bacterium]HWB71652.1 nitroreductase family protein [Egibacteraceae bacterium]
METWDAIRARRNVRDYQDRPIPPEDVNRILEAARRTPSSSNQQRWDFVVVTDHSQLERLAQVWRGAAHVARSAATIGLVAPVTDDQGTRVSVHYDLGQATMSIMLAAADLGIGSGHAAVRDQDLARKVLNLPNDRELAWLIALGYPAQRPLDPISEPKRRPFEEVVHRGRW